MKITHITPGLIPIPPNGWGAVEKIIWEYHQNLISLGHASEIKFLNDVFPGHQDIVHVHVANLALECHERGIPYIFTMHDHHAFLYGPDSHAAKENKEALKNSLLGIVPAKYLIDYFDLPNVVYLSHGVNTGYFRPKPERENRVESILCVANNGYIHDQSVDRKGFGYAIEAAKKLNLPITICGPENNRSFFESRSFDYERLTIKYNLTESELLNEYNSHSIFVHASELEAGHPNLTVLEAMSSGLPVLSTIEKGQTTLGLIEISRDADSIVERIKLIDENYQVYSNNSINSAELVDWRVITKELVDLYKSVSAESMKKSLIYNYSKTDINYRPKKIPKNKFLYSFISGAKCEILGPSEKEYKVDFIDDETSEIIFSANIKNNCWASPSKKYFIKWRINVYDGSDLVDFHVYDATDKKVYIHLDSKALGDNIAWFPFIDEFRKKHNCKVVCSTFWNSLFKENYPEIEFLSPGSVSHGLYAMYSIGWYYFDDGRLDFDKHKIDIKKIPLQQTASDFLGIDYREIKPNIVRPIERRYVLGDYVCIAPHASSHAKYWNREGGWQNLIDWFKDSDINTAMITHEPLGDQWHDSKLGGKLQGVIDRTGDFPIENRINEILHSKMFIGLSSGLSWLSWALGKPTVVISGFTEEFLEPSSVIRIINKDVCHGCQTDFKLDPGDWEWCPKNKGTKDHFICTKEISFDMVKEAIQKEAELDI
jgi:autotransporter strand-loop-strand O-heptosyltransferase